MKTSRPSARLGFLVAAMALSLPAWAVLPAAGTVNSVASGFSAGRVTAAEHPWVIRILSYHPDPVVPRRIYSASCVYNGQRRIFASLTTTTPSSSATQGTIVSADIGSGGTVSGFTQRGFAECEEMNGIAATADCSTVVAMCRRPAGATGATKDLVASLPNTTTGNDWRNWLTGEAADDQMWLYEWKGSPALANNSTAAPLKYVVSKAIGGGWEFGHQNVVISATHYGLSMKSTTGKDASGVQHQGDTFLAINRVSPGIDTSRGWRWACGVGHTLSNRPALSTSGAFAALCTTDSNNMTGAQKNGGVWMHVENKTASLVRTIYESRVSPQLRFNGGATSLLAIPGGGYIGMIVGSDNPFVEQPAKIGFVRLNADGLTLSTRWVAQNPAYFLSYPQVVSLGIDSTGSPRYLVGWAQMMATAASSLDAVNPDHSQRLAGRYFVQEVDQNGNPKAAIREVVHGWGEQNQMIPLANGMAGWVHTPDPRYRQPLPTPKSSSLQWTTYSSTSM